MKRAPLPVSRYNVALLGLIRPYLARYIYITSPAAFFKIIKIYYFSYFSFFPLFLFYITGYFFRFLYADLRFFLLVSTAYRRSLYFALI